jgi:hypothetical protein
MPSSYQFRQRSNAKSNGQHAAEHDQRAAPNDVESDQKLAAKSSSENGSYFCENFINYKNSR